MVNDTPGRFIPRKDPVNIVQEAAWAPGSVWTGAENLAPPEIRSPDRPTRSVVAVPTTLPGALMYRVSIKSFPDYKHLLQENYVEYKHIFTST